MRSHDQQPNVQVNVSGGANIHSMAITFTTQQASTKRKNFPMLDSKQESMPELKTSNSPSFDHLKTKEADSLGVLPIP